MYSNGIPEMGNDNNENLPIFFNKLLKAIEKLKNIDISEKTLTLRPLFADGNSVIKIDNWTFTAVKEATELHVTNLHADQKTILRREVTGFEFESNKSEIVQFLATSELKNELNTTWMNINRLLNSKKENIPITVAQESSSEETLKLRHLKRLQRLEEPSIMVKPPRSQKPGKSAIPVTSLKSKKSENSSSMLSSSARLSALQQYLSAVSSKSVQLKQSQLKQNVNKYDIY